MSEMDDLLQLVVENAGGGDSIAHRALMSGVGNPKPKLPHCRQDNAGTKFCWLCSKRLQRVSGRPRFVYFHVVVDPIGAEHRVHGDCAQEAIADGNKFKPQEAQA